MNKNDIEVILIAKNGIQIGYDSYTDTYYMYDCDDWVALLDLPENTGDAALAYCENLV